MVSRLQILQPLTVGIGGAPHRPAMTASLEPLGPGKVGLDALTSKADFPTSPGSPCLHRQLRPGAPERHGRRGAFPDTGAPARRSARNAGRLRISVPGRGLELQVAVVRMPRSCRSSAESCSAAANGAARTALAALLRSPRAATRHMSATCRGGAPSAAFPASPRAGARQITAQAACGAPSRTLCCPPPGPSTAGTWIPSSASPRSRR
jgi:hypothetical protein